MWEGAFRNSTQETERLPLEAIGKCARRLERRAECGAERAVIDKGPLGLEQKKTLLQRGRAKRRRVNGGRRRRQRIAGERRARVLVGGLRDQDLDRRRVEGAKALGQRRRRRCHSLLLMVQVGVLS
jgi:hypothetical protein